MVTRYDMHCMLVITYNFQYFITNVSACSFEFNCEKTFKEESVI